MITVGRELESCGDFVQSSWRHCVTSLVSDTVAITLACLLGEPEGAMHCHVCSLT